MLFNHPRHIENGTYPHVNFYGFGLSPENINHEGNNQSAMRTHPSWGECSGIFTGLADSARFTGGGGIDLEHGFAVGTDGIILSLEQRGDALHVTASSRISKLKLPWEHPYEIELMVRGKNERSLFLSGTRSTIEDREGMRLIRCKVAPDPNVSLRSN